MPTCVDDGRMRLHCGQRVHSPFSEHGPAARIYHRVALLLQSPPSRSGGACGWSSRVANLSKFTFPRACAAKIKITLLALVSSAYSNNINMNFLHTVYTKSIHIPPSKRPQNKPRKVMCDKTERWDKRDKDVNLAGQFFNEVGVKCNKRKKGRKLAGFLRCRAVERQCCPTHVLGGGHTFRHIGQPWM